jgi:uncharacterized RDD family membrane protein YckC
VSAAPATALPAPPLLRRLLCLVYEGVLLFGVVMLAGLFYAGVTQQRHALHGQWGLRIFLVFVLGVYFIGFWIRGGQTLAMKTWHIRLLSADGTPVAPARGAVRYLLSWLWFMPALAVVYFSGLTGTAAISASVLAGVLAYAALAWLHPTRQFWHDIVSGTRLVDTRGAQPVARGGVGQNRLS